MFKKLNPSLSFAASFTVLVALTATSLPAFAQSTAPTASAQSSALFTAFGGLPGVTQLVDDFHQRLLADARMAPHFKPINAKHIKEQLTDQFCAVMGGPCVYKGADMKSAHSSLDIKKSDFNALVEVLQTSMDARGIAFSAQNQLLAKLAPMHRDVITVD